MVEVSARLTEIRQRHHQGKRWNCAEDIGDLLGLVDEALGHIDALLPSTDSCDLGRDTICRAHGGCDACKVARAREFVGGLQREVIG